MFNLLPTKHKKFLRKTYALRRASLVFGFVTILGLSAILLFVPFFMLARLEVRGLEQVIAEAQRAAEGEESSEYRSALNETKNLLALFPAESEPAQVGAVFRAVIDQRGDEIALTDLIYKASDDHVFQVAVAGIASNRDALRAFGKRLEGYEMFGDVDLPVSNFTEQVNITFSLTIDSNEKQ